jgi:hypothetical protein
MFHDAFHVDFVLRFCVMWTAVYLPVDAPAFIADEDVKFVRRVLHHIVKFKLFFLRWATNYFAGVAANGEVMDFHLLQILAFI